MTYYEERIRARQRFFTAKLSEKGKVSVPVGLFVCFRFDWIELQPGYMGTSHDTQIMRHLYANGIINVDNDLEVKKYTTK